MLFAVLLLLQLLSVVTSGGNKNSSPSTNKNISPTLPLNIVLKKPSNLLFRLSNNYRKLKKRKSRVAFTSLGLGDFGYIKDQFKS